MFNLDKKLWQWITMLFLAFIWGASFILMKKGLETFTYVQVGAMRMFFSFLMLLPIAIKNLKFVNKKNAPTLIICGLLGNFFPAFLFALSETEISSSLAGILNGLTPFFVVIVGVVVFKNRPNILQYIGVLIGFIGAALLVTNGDFSNFGEINIFVLFVVLATFFYGINSNIVRFKLQELNGVQITSLAFFFLGPPAGIILLFTDINAALQSTVFLPSLLYILTLATFGSVITLIIFYNLIHKTSALFASSSTYIIPFFALMWGLFDGENISFIHLYCLLIILVGVYLSSIKQLPKFIFSKKYKQ